MQKITGSFKNNDTLTIHTTNYQPDTDPKAIVIIVHGMGEHSGRYEHVAERLVSAGYEVYTLDHRGHGQSEGKRVQVASQTHFMEDLKMYFDSIVQRHPHEKIFILGHSMGSVITLQFTLKYQDLLTGVIVTGTATNVASSVPGFARTLLNAAHSIVPHMPFLAPGDADILTNDTEMQQKWRDDSLNYMGWIPMSLVKYIGDTGEMVQNNASQITLPILIMHGEDDTLASISGSHIMYERVASKDKTLKTWKNMQHEIMNEVEREAVLNVIVDWLDKH